MCFRYSLAGFDWMFVIWDLVLGIFELFVFWDLLFGIYFFCICLFLGA